MIRILLKKIISKFERQYGYDANYMHEINTVSSAALLRLLSFQGITNYRGSEPSIWGGAALAATLHGDCGPCAQLMTDRLVELGQSTEQIKACLEHRCDQAGSMGLGYQFAQAVLLNTEEIDKLADRIRSEFGQDCLIAAAYAASTYTTYPLLKRALGQAQACHKIDLGHGVEVAVSVTS